MKNNRLIITYNDSVVSNMNAGAKESFRCTKLSRAKEIVQYRDKSIIKEAMFKDRDGKEWSTIDLLVTHSSNKLS